MANALLRCAEARVWLRSRHIRGDRCGRLTVRWRYHWFYSRVWYNCGCWRGARGGWPGVLVALQGIGDHALKGSQCIVRDVQACAGTASRHLHGSFGSDAVETW